MAFSIFLVLIATWCETRELFRKSEDGLSFVEGGALAVGATGDVDVVIAVFPFCGASFISPSSSLPSPLLASSIVTCFGFIPKKEYPRVLLGRAGDGIGVNASTMIDGVEAHNLDEVGEVVAEWT